MLRPEHGKKHEEDDALIVPLMWWLGIAERRHGMDRHTALRWFVQQCKDKEEKEMFDGIFGNAIVDSIARRLYQKAKEDGMFALADSRHEELGRVSFEGIEDDNLYELAWKALSRWVKGAGGCPGVAYDIIRHEVPHRICRFQGQIRSKSNHVDKPSAELINRHPIRGVYLRRLQTPRGGQRSQHEHYHR